MVKYHLVVLKKAYLDLIVEGRKTIESRFLKVNKAPFGQVSAGDVLFLKESSGPVVGKAAVKAAEFFDDLSPEKIREIKERYNHLIGGSDEYWQERGGCRFGVLVWIGNVERIEPVRITKKDWRGWVVLTERENFGLLKTRDTRLR
jgi:ASC-1-like (ASCH) protein